MYRIGDFSRVANVTVKTLRYYAREGLLTPVWVDRFTSYRCYTLEQLAILNRILALKDLGFTLEEIKPMLHSTLSVCDLRELLTQKKAELEMHLQEGHQRLIRVEQRLEQIEAEESSPMTDVVIRRLRSGTAAIASSCAAVPSQVPNAKQLLSRQISEWCTTRRLRISGPWFSLLQNNAYSDRDVEINLGVCVEGNQQNLAESSSEPVRLERIGEVPAAACLLGNLEKLPPLPALMRWIDLNAFQVDGQIRMVYLGDQSDDKFEKGVVELQAPVKPKVTGQIKKENEMEPVKYETLPAFKVMGMKYRGKNENQEISMMWEELNKRAREIPMRGECAYGVCLMLPNAPKGFLEYIAGFKVDADALPPKGMVVIDVPESTYAVFEHIGSLKTLGNTYRMICDEWFPRSGKQPAGGFDMEVYDERFKGFDPDSVFYIYEPVK
jgi:predicted transcriptional regulator YdeE/DNA-binding transcriptional MerR regulator